MVVGAAGPFAISPKAFVRPLPYDPVKDFAPAATPKDMIVRLNADVVRVLSTPETKALMIKFGAESAPSTPEATGQLLKDELERWGQVVKSSGVKLE